MTDFFIVDYRMPPSLLPVPSTLPPHSIMSRLRKVTLQVNDLNSAYVEKDMSAWQSAFFLDEVQVELSGEAAEIMCSPADVPLGPEQSMHSCNIFFSLLMKLDKAVVLKYDPPIHPTFYSEWDGERQQRAPDHSKIRGYIERQTRVRH